VKLIATFDGRLWDLLAPTDLTEVWPLIDEMGFAAVQLPMGSVFDAGAKGHGIKPWKQLDAIKAGLKKTPILGDLRAQGPVEQRVLADDAVELLLTRLVESGVHGFRFFDPLNDLRNLEAAIGLASSVSKFVEGSLCFVPGFDVGHWQDMARRLVAMGSRAVVLRDPNGRLTPTECRQLVPLLAEAKASVVLGLRGGDLAMASTLAGVEAGATTVDATLAKAAGLDSVPSAAALLAALTPNVDLALLAEIETRLLCALGPSGSGPAEAVSLYCGAPPGLVRAAAELLAEHDAIDRLPAVVVEMQSLLTDLGQPAMVGPVTKVLASQAVMNVISGERYATVTQGLKDYLHGLWGTANGPVDGEIRRQVLGRDEFLTVRPAELLDPQVEPARARLRKLGVEESDENILLTLLFPHLGPASFADDPPLGPPTAEAPVTNVPEPSDEKPETVTVNEYDVEVEGEVFRVRVTPAGMSFLVAGPAAGAGVSGSSPAAVAGPGSVLAPMQGLIVKVPVKKGDTVKAGDVVAVLEAMKMQNDIVATTSGAIHEVHVREGDVVAPNQPLVTVR
jgi:pyruvate carboxylase subunit B